MSAVTGNRMRNPVRPNRALIVLLACCDSADSGGAHRRGLGWHLRPVVFVLLTDDNIASVLWVAALVNAACIAAPRCPFGLAIMTEIWIRMVLLPVSSPDSCSAVCSSISMWVPLRSFSLFNSVLMAMSTELHLFDVALESSIAFFTFFRDEAERPYVRGRSQICFIRCRVSWISWPREDRACSHYDMLRLCPASIQAQAFQESFPIYLRKLKECR